MTDDTWLRARVLAAYGMKDYDAGLAPVPLRIRMWRAATFAYRRGKAVDWRSYNTAEAECRARREAFEAALPARMQEAADMLNGLLPEGLQFGWRTGETAMSSPGDEPEIVPLGLSGRPE